MLVSKRATNSNNLMLQTKTHGTPGFYPTTQFNPPILFQEITKILLVKKTLKLSKSSCNYSFLFVYLSLPVGLKKKKAVSLVVDVPLYCRETELSTFVLCQCLYMF